MSLEGKRVSELARVTAVSDEDLLILDKGGSELNSVFVRDVLGNNKVDDKVSKTGDTMTGTLKNKGGIINVIAQNLDFDPNNPPQQNIYGTEFRLSSKDEKVSNLGYVSNAWFTTGELRTRLGINRKVGTTNYYKEIGVRIDTNNVSTGYAPNPPSNSNNDSIATTQWSRGLLTGKSIIKDYIVEFNSSGLNWYRKWSSGWLEQCITINATTDNVTLPFTFLKSYRDTNWSFSVSWFSSTNNFNQAQPDWIIAKTTTGGTYHNDSYPGTKYVIAFGYAG